MAKRAYSVAIRLYVNALGHHPGPGRCRVKFRDTEFTSEAMFQVTEASLTCPGQKLSLAHWQDVFILGTSSLKAPGQLPLLRRSVRSRAWAGPLPARPQRRRGWRSEVAVPTASRTPGLAGRALTQNARRLNMARPAMGPEECRMDLPRHTRTVSFVQSCPLDVEYISDCCGMGRTLRFSGECLRGCSRG